MARFISSSALLWCVSEGVLAGALPLRAGEVSMSPRPDGVGAPLWWHV